MVIGLGGTPLQEGQATGSRWYVGLDLIDAGEITQKGPAQRPGRR